MKRVPIHCAIALFAWFAVSSVPAQNADTLTLAVSYDLFPYCFVEEGGEPQGMLIDLWRTWSARTGIEVEFLVFSWDESLDAVRASMPIRGFSIRPSAANTLILRASRSR